MAGMEIFLIIVGVTAIIGSFVFAKTLEKNDNTNENNSGVTEAMLEEQVSKAVDHILDDRIEETEAKMDKLSSEKIMAVGDYSDNVLKEIDKNHDEVMFLYSMLNEKEKEVKNAVKDVENIKRSINVIANNENTGKSNELETFANNQINDNIKNTKVSKKTVSDASDMKEDVKNLKVKESEKIPENNVSVKDNSNSNLTVSSAKDNRDKNLNSNTSKKNKGVAIAHKDVKKNNNNKILELYSKGMSNIDIAKELNLGMGEVRLVIDLYKNKKR
ncbi:MAG: DUF6115 domain-containing protein [Lachnospiraceae bacterium]|nr:DUF6115 domain-containing protein [Clostridiales bacterium]MDD6294222.1 DUF6115 domain-containing protein [Eubacteriales bacterium]MDY2607211.1 DUF6115 domain-containing protein [Lachnospiraceae bacterium]